MQDSDLCGRRQILILLVLVFAFSIIGQVHAADVTVVFRFDDYSADSDAAVEVRLIETFRSRQIPLVVGVIPCVGATGRDDGAILSDEKAGVLREAVQAGTVDVALHGYSHRKTGPWTEFAGLPYDEQLHRLQRGQGILYDAVGMNVTTFIPPYNAYDRVTLQAMQQRGFACLCAGKLGPDDTCSLALLPSTCGFAHARQAIESAQRAAEARTVVILFHAWDMADPTLSRDFVGWTGLEELLDWVTRQENVTVRSIRGLLDSDADLSLQRFVANKRLSSTPAYVPDFLIRLFGTETHAYLSTSEAHSFQGAKRGLYAATVAFYTGLVLVGVVTAALVRKRMRRSAVLLLRCAGIVILAAAIVYACRDLTLGYRGALLISVAAGICLGLSVPIPSRLKPATH